MINTKYLLYISTCLLVSSNVQASNIKLTYDSSDIFSHGSALHTQLHTPNELKPISSFNPDNAVKLAAVCSVGGGGCSGLEFGKSNNSMLLDKAAQCKDEGYATSCPSGYVLDYTKQCLYNKSYFKCRVCSHTCPSGSLNNCSSTQVLTGTTSNDCLETCYQCRDKTCAEGGYAVSINSCQNGTAVSFANKTCYKNVTAKTCENGGYKSTVPTNNKCTAVIYCSKTCQSNCYQPTCEEGGYKSAVPANNVCTDVTYYGRTCKKDCKQPTCENGGYKSGVPNNQVCTPVSYYGRTCYQNCYQPQCTAGGYVSACPTNQIGTSVTYYGRNCYKNCYQPQCSAGGYKDSIPTNNKCTAVTYYGRNCYKDCKQPTCSDGGYKDTPLTYMSCTSLSYYGRTCYTTDCKTLLPILYSDLTTSNTIISNKTPIGIVFDTNKRLALALDQANQLSWSSSRTDIPGLENCDIPRFCGTDGKANTATIIVFGKEKSISYPAAEYCYNYTTPGTTAGDWFLPSYAELFNIYQKKSQINATLNLLGRPLFKENDYWSSTENDNEYSWRGCTCESCSQIYNGTNYGDGIYGAWNKQDNSHSVRPVLAF